MTTAIAQNGSQQATEPRRSLIQALADQYGVEPAHFLKTVKETVFNGKGTEAEMIAFFMVANKHKLDPFTKEIFAFPKQGGGVQTIVSVDGWLSIINNHPQMDGIEYVDHFDDKGNLSAVTCRIYRKDRSHPTEVTEYMAECRRNTSTWSQWPRRMLRHKATIQCGRQAFSISGIVDPDEAEREIEGSVRQTGSRVTRAPLVLPKPTTDECLDHIDDANQLTDESHEGIDEPAPEQQSQEPPTTNQLDTIRERYAACKTLKDRNAADSDIMQLDLSDEENAQAAQWSREAGERIRAEQAERKESFDANGLPLEGKPITTPRGSRAKKEAATA